MPTTGAPPAAGDRRRGTVRAAGAVLWRPAPSGLQVALVHRPRYDDWSLPKGKLDPGEDEATAAAREVAEETGFACVLGRELGRSRYDVLVDGVWTPKTVRWWSACCTTGAFVPGREVDALDWLPVEQAAARVTAGRDRHVLEAFAAWTPEQVREASLVVLLRHAEAGSRADWSGPDEDRPLDPSGRAQAVALAGRLAPHGITRLLAAPPVRCRETLAPLGDLLRLPVEQEPLLGDAGHARDPDAALSLLRGLPPGTVACSQGEALPALLAALTAGAAAPPAVRKGTGRVLSLWHGRLLQSDVLALPGD